MKKGIYKITDKASKFFGQRLELEKLTNSHNGYFITSQRIDGQFYYFRGDQIEAENKVAA